MRRDIYIYDMIILSLIINLPYKRAFKRNKGSEIFFGNIFGYTQ